MISSVHLITTALCTLPAAAVGLAIFDALRPSAGPAAIGLGGAVSVGGSGSPVHVELVVEGVVVQLLRWGRGVEVLGHWGCTVVSWCMGARVWAVKGCGAIVCRVGILWRDPDTT